MMKFEYTHWGRGQQGTPEPHHLVSSGNVTVAGEKKFLRLHIGGHTSYKLSIE